LSWVKFNNYEEHIYIERERERERGGSGPPRGGSERGQAGARAPPQDILIFINGESYFFISKRWVLLE